MELNEEQLRIKVNNIKDLRTLVSLLKGITSQVEDRLSLLELEEYSFALNNTNISTQLDICSGILKFVLSRNTQDQNECAEDKKIFDSYLEKKDKESVNKNVRKNKPRQRNRKQILKG
jgi:hypothetical protein